MDRIEEARGLLKDARSFYDSESTLPAVHSLIWTLENLIAEVTSLRDEVDRLKRQ